MSTAERPQIKPEGSHPRGFAIETRIERPSRSAYQKKLISVAGWLKAWCRDSLTDLEERRQIDDEFEKGMPDELDPEQRDIKVVCISDTHGTRPGIPRGDILIHAGDLTNKGTFDEVQSQLDWLNDQPHPYKVVIAGNHDIILDDKVSHSHPRISISPGKTRKDLRWGSILYLQDEFEELEVGYRRVSIYGSPQSLNCGGKWAFQHNFKDDIWCNKLPENLDILIVHGPPAGHLDNDLGDPFLAKEISRVRPRLVVFGHIHEAVGQELVLFDDVQQQFDSIKLGHRGVAGVARMLGFAMTKRFSGSERERVTQLVNASAIDIFPEHDDRNREPQVITL